jgi:hypothetical protein
MDMRIQPPVADGHYFNEFLPEDNRIAMVICSWVFA